MPRLLSAVLVLLLAARAPAQQAAFPFQKGDRVAWVGSSSTAIGVWPRTMELLLRTRHPDLDLTFKKATSGGGTFMTGLQNYDRWLADYKPTVVFLNYGGNDANAGEKGLTAFKDNMGKLVAHALDGGARVVLLTPQGADERKAGKDAADRRRVYAETMVAYAREKGWPVVDVHGPLDALQRAGQKDDDAYSILKDTIHLTDAAYVAWAFYLYERLGPPPCDCLAALTASGEVTAATRCRVTDVKAADGALSFTRRDAVLPLLPPGPLPPRRHVPLERLSPYLLCVTGLPEGRYEVRCDGRPVGAADAAALARGVNLNALPLDAGHEAPWAGLVKQLSEGKALDQVGKTAWRFEVRRAPGR